MVYREAGSDRLYYVYSSLGKTLEAFMKYDSNGGEEDEKASG